MRQAGWTNGTGVDRGTPGSGLGFAIRRRLPLLATLALALTTALPAPARAEVPLGTAISVGTQPWGVAVNPATNRIYATNRSAGTVSVIDGQTNGLVGSAITTGTEAAGVAVNPVTNRIYVTDPTANTLAVIDGATNAVVSTIAVGPGPSGVAVNPSTNRVYVVNGTSQDVSIVDGATNTVVGTFPVGGSPARVAVNSITNRIYITMLASNQVGVVDGATNTAVAVVGTPAGPLGIAVDEIANRVYVTDSSVATVSVIDGSTNTIASTISVGPTPNGVAVNPATHRIYAVNNGGNSVSIVDGASNLVLGSAVPVGTAPIEVAVNPVLNRIYVTNNGSDTVTVLGVPFSTAPGVVGASITATWSDLSGPTGGDWVGLFPQGAPDGPPLSARFTNGAASPGGSGLAAGSVTVPVPEGLTPGVYEVRLLANTSPTARLAIAPVTIGQASLSVVPTTAAAGSVVQATFGGIVPPTGGDWVGLYQQGAADPTFLARRYTNGTETPGGPGAAGGTLSLPLPSNLAPGPYELRLFSNGSFQQMAVTSLAVTRATLTPDLTIVTLGQPVTVRWSGITGPSGDDVIGLYRPGAPDSEPLLRRFTNGTESPGGTGSAAGSLSLPIPVGLTQGRYDLRLLSGVGGGTLATSDVVIGVGVASCQPRPSVTTLTTPRGDHLDVTIVASALNPETSNRLRELHFGQLQNARVTVNGQTVTSGQGITLASQPTTLTFTIQRATPGQPTLAPFTVVDDCGSWPSFAGGGVNAGF
ncbi:MAG: YncE family protein [Chloroflexi bacterium]|nr:YncE family protein [Chloroflexota bacterium]